MMQDCGRTLVARVEEEGEVRELWTEVRGGWLTVGEDTCGPTTRVVFGEDWQRGAVTLSPQALALAGLESAAELESRLSKGDVLLVDVMDELDARGVPYAFSSVVGEGGVAYRPAPPALDAAQGDTES